MIMFSPGLIYFTSLFSLVASILFFVGRTQKRLEAEFDEEVKEFDKTVGSCVKKIKEIKAQRKISGPVFIDEILQAYPEEEKEEEKELETEEG